MSAPEDRPLDPSAADRVIQRAMELDAQRAEALTESQLREIAAEMSLSPIALDQALAEYRARSGSVEPAAGSRSSRVQWYWKAGTYFSVVALLATIAAVAIRL